MKRAKTKDIPIEEVKDRLLYDYVSGALVWKKNRQKALIGKEAGCVKNDKYRHIRIGASSYNASRIAWTLAFGEIKDGLVIDHIDRDRSNNRLENLRVVTQKENVANRTPKFGGKDHRYYTLHVTGKMQAVYKGKYLGLFDNEVEAAKAVEVAKGGC